MKRYLTLAASLLMTAVSAMAQLTASEAFTSAPQGVFPLLDQNTRLDMVDYFKSGMSTPSQNALQGKSQITDLTPTTLSVRMTDSSTAQIAVLDAGKNQVIALISTVATPGLDSNVKFFDSSWRPLNLSQYFAKPGWPEWLTDEGKSHRSDVEMQVPFMLASYQYDPSTGSMTLTNNLSRFLDKGMYEMIASYLKPQLVYVWNGKKFELKR